MCNFKLNQSDSKQMAEATVRSVLCSVPHMCFSKILFSCLRSLNSSFPLGSFLKPSF